MPRKHFSGITTVEDLKGRCIVDDFTECWHWKGATTLDRRGTPMQRVWVYDTVQKRFRTMGGPLAVLEISGKRTAAMTMGWRTCRCNGCMNPAHVIGGTRAQWGEWNRLHGHWRNNPVRIAANRRNARLASELDIDTVRAVRGSPLNGRQAAVEFELTEAHISQIRLHRIWKEGVVPGASVFTLGAA